MVRATIDYGIDLGTTNSSIALLKGTQVEVFRNNEGFEYTPSAVYIDKNSRTFVGRRAKEQLENDPDNAFCEFKLLMGTGKEFTFARNGKKVKPEELSSEVLKSLKADVKQRIGEDVRASVITVPAAFELPQCDATRKAAQLAGFGQSPLLQEPVAAALAYGFQSQTDKVFWLVFDFGGGTFDAAIIQVRDGVVQVVNHGGDNHLGGKLIDWEIVEQLMIPALLKQAKLQDFRRGNPKWRAAIAKLKLHAEEAKIRVSRDDSTEVVIDGLCQDGRGNTVRFEYELNRRDVERVVEPYVLRAINICKRVLSEKRLQIEDIEKVILVGGPTLTPYFRQRLSDRREGLGIPLEFTVDPLTVVARGAAIFAGTQQTKGAGIQEVPTGQYAVQLEYKPMGPETDPLVGGKVLAPQGEGLQGFTIEFVNSEARPPWRSGKLPLAANGGFITNLVAEKGRQNTYLIELRDATGSSRKTSPDRLRYTVGLSIDDLPLIHSMGVALANNEMEWYFDKGTRLPAGRQKTLRTTIDVKPGQAGDVIRIPVMEGENERADRNHRIGTLEIAAQKVKRNVPAGSEVKFTIEINESRLVRVKAYIPLLDEEFADALKFGYDERSFDTLSQEVAREKARFEEIEKKARDVGDPRVREALERIRREDMVREVDVSLAASQTDADAAEKCKNRLLDLRVALDEVEKALEWPALVSDAESLLSAAKDLVNSHGTSDDKSTFGKHESAVRSAMQTRDVDVLRNKMEELRVFAMRILDKQGVLQAIFFEQLCSERAKMRDQAQANDLIAQGRRAASSNDNEALRSVNRQLAALLPEPPRPPDLSTVMR